MFQLLVPFDIIIMQLFIYCKYYNNKKKIDSIIINRKKEREKI